MNTYTSYVTVVRINSHVISFNDRSGVDLSFAPGAKVGDKYAVTINSDTNEIIAVTKVS